MANQTKNFYEAYQDFFVGGGGSVAPTPEVEEAIQNLQQAYNALQEQVNQLPTEDTDTIFDPTPINEALQSLQQEIQDNGTLDLSNITTLQNAITALQEQVNQLPTEDTDTVFDPTPLNNSIFVLQTSLQQFREQAEIAQAQQAAALAANTELDAQQQQSITNLTSRVTALEDAPIQTKIIGYQQATAQEIIEFIEQNPHAPLVIDSNGEQQTVLFALKQADNKVMLRVLGSISGKWHIFQHNIQDQRWTAVTFPLQDKLESGTSIKTINGESLLGSGDIAITPTQPQPEGTFTTITVPNLQRLSVTYDDVTVPANSRVNLQNEAIQNFPEGGVIVGYYQITKAKGSSAPQGDAGWQKVSIESFATTGGSVRPNVSFFNNANTDVIIKAIFGVLVMTSQEYTVLVQNPANPTNGEGNG